MLPLYLGDVILYHITSYYIHIISILYHIILYHTISYHIMQFNLEDIYFIRYALHSTP
jgi:hypothetical protein